ncbi:ACL075Cp [Eremothecium gossypii ATCC 10895]|uniref:ACL075Cp n=1 Tax=Eremothecium gossypii (strain ATCC 10895 / CBS 109.51 / FGSC 9923 / NRRL Y-1056) TaxID=284811 RepID=Q75CJ4_EREGS|nr:ACL075Cp [Eremothecium gossypii ATCC 10895]AAS51153.1 ACL075Cp [Eremothecium gossypii ATCC 10895]
MSTSSPAKNKRSISSAIAGLFRRPADGASTAECADCSTELPIEYESNTSSDTVIKRPRAGVRGAEPLILYESDVAVRPPVLPILPLQRLRMLRHRQELRRRQYQLAPLVQSGHGGRIVSEASGEGWRRIAGGTRSASALGRAGTGKKGRLWSSNFEYDLSEYDVLKKQKLNTRDAKDITMLDSPKLSEEVVLKNGAARRDAGEPPFSSNLSRAQLKLLTGCESPALLRGEAAAGGKSIDGRTPYSKPHDGAAAGPKKMPSVGFDFLLKADADTPSKTKLPALPAPAVSLTLDENRPAQPSRAEETVRPAETPSAPLLAFGNQGQDVSKPAAQPQLSFTFGAPKAAGGKDVAEPAIKATSPEESTKKPAFSFNISNGGANKAPFSFGASAQTQNSGTTSNTPNGGAQGSAKPTFSFGQNFGASQQAENKPNTTSSEDKSSPSKDAPAPPIFGNGKPTVSGFSFSNGSREATVPSKKADSTSGNPTLMFGNGIQNKEPQTTPTFSDDKKDTSSKPTFQFVIPAKSNTNASNTNTTFGTTMNGNSVSSATNLFSGSSSETAKSSNNQAVPTLSDGSAVKGTSLDRQNTLSPVTFGAPSAQPTTSGSLGAAPFSFKTTTPDTSNPTNPPSLLFGNNVNGNGSLSSTSAPVTSGAASNSGGFKFDMSGFKNNQGVTSPVPTFSMNNNVSQRPGNNMALNGSSMSIANAPQPQQATAFGFPQDSVSNGTTAFGSGLTTANNSPAFGISTNNNNSNNNQPAAAFTFGSNAGSPAPSLFANSASSALQNNRPVAFTPSSSVNLNFGGAPAASLDPSQVFGQAATGQPQNSGFGMPQQPMMHLPPGRRIARMRARRG